MRPSGDTPLVAEHPEIPAELALQGFDGVRAYSDATRVQRRSCSSGCSAPRRWATTRGSCAARSAAATIAYDEPPAEPGRQSAGTVHHVAWGTTVAEHPRWEERLRDAGVPTSGIVDRHYFHSIYFREPSGVLFEIADDGPGFTVDGYSVEELGSTIILPPQLEPHRERIEAILTPLPDPRALRSPAR